MKNIYKLFGIIALVTVVMFSFAACEEDPGDDGVPKSLVITGIDKGSGAITVGICDAPDKKNPKGVIHAFSKVPYGANITVPLISAVTNVQFTGTGNFYILMIFDGETSSDSDDITYVYSQGSLVPLPFALTEGSSTIPFSQFMEYK